MITPLLIARVIVIKTRYARAIRTKDLFLSFCRYFFHGIIIVIIKKSTKALMHRNSSHTKRQLLILMHMMLPCDWNTPFSQILCIHTFIVCLLAISADRGSNVKALKQQQESIVNPLSFSFTTFTFSTISPLILGSTPECPTLIKSTLKQHLVCTMKITWQLYQAMISIQIYPVVKPTLFKDRPEQTNNNEIF